MRITNSMTMASTLSNINTAANRLATANERYASQKKIQLASDDSAVASRAVTYRSYVSDVKQYQDNTDAASGWQKQTDTALTNLNDLVAKVKEGATKAASDTCNDTDKANIKTEVETWKTEAISLLNTSYAGRYVFAGYSTNKEPYAATTTDVGDNVTYKGKNLGGVISASVSDDDIKTFYAKSAGNIYESTATVSTTAATAKDVYDTLAAASGATLTDVAAAAKTAADVANSAAAAAPTDTTLKTKATTANTTSAILAKAVITYGGTTALTAATTAAKNTSDTLAVAVTAGGATASLATTASTAKTTATTLTAAVTTYGGTTTLTTAAANALTDYNTANAASIAAPGDATLTATAAAAKTTSDTLATTVTNYGTAATTTTLSTAASTAQATSDTLAAAVKTYGGTTDQSIKYNIGFDSQVTINTEGQDVTGEGTDSNLFDTFTKLSLALDGATSYKTASVDSSGTVTVATKSLSISGLLDELTTDLSRIQTSQATLGARMNKVTNASDILSDASTAYKNLKSDNEDVDISEASTEQASAKVAYEAALSVGAKAISKSLIDYVG